MTFRELLTHAPIRDYLGARVTAASGRGIELAIMVVFVVQTVGVTREQVGFATSAAAVTGLLVGFPAGVIADRVGARRTLMVLTLAQVLAMSSFVLVFNFPSYLVAVCIFTACYSASYPVSQALAGSITTDATRAPAMAATRAAVNLGIAVGSVVALLYLSTGVGWHGRASLGFAAVLVGLSLVFYLRMPGDVRVEPVPLRATFAAAKDWRYGILAFLMAPNLMVFQLLTIGVPLWVTFHGNLSNSLVSICTLLNTLIIVALQFPLGARINTVRRARTSLFLVGFGLAATCVCMGLGLGVHTVWLAATLVILAAVLLSFTEIIETSANWELSYSFAPAATRTTHLALFGMASSVADIIGPIALSSWVMGAGSLGWYLLGAFLAAVALAQVYYVTMFFRRRPERLQTVVETIG